MEIKLGDITRPKSKTIVIPANTKGLMNRGILLHILQQSQQGLGDISPIVKKTLNQKSCGIGDVFVTGAGGLRRRGVRTIYHVIIKRLSTDFTSLDIVRKSLENCCCKLRENKVKYAALCGLGLDKGDLDPTSVARVFLSVLKKYEIFTDFKILDTNEMFIKELQKGV